ncbi:tetratricopeptide repeat protein [Streptomyces syringium]|uniref:tetratricopeptide repeat protein n=1 Tax=Streptomyces syringium TaxID=76729 RepID=UPI0033B3E159
MTTHNDFGGRAEQVIQGRDIGVTFNLPDRPPSALAGLPPCSATFVGRDRQVRDLVEGLAPSTEDRVPVAVVTGPAGVGKTELVLQAAGHALRQPGWFPGGVLFVDLFGYDSARRIAPPQALVTLLHALGVPSEHVPPDLPERSQLFRTELAERAEAGQRVLVVLDNAASEEDVRHLLPSDKGTAVLISSRHTLAGLDARPHRLGLLPADAGVTLLRDVLRQACERDSRVSDAPQDAKRLTELCDGLPLALRIVASLLVDRPNRPLSSIREALEDSRSRLDTLSREDRAVRAAFDLSYEQLSPDQARLFRLLCLNPGPDFSTEAAAQLNGSGIPAADRLLDGLARMHLVALGRTDGRWRLHDLVHLYAADCLRAEGGDSDGGDSLHRLWLHYCGVSLDAKDRAFVNGDDAQPAESRFKSRADALGWLEAERHSLMAVALTTHRGGDHVVCVAIALHISPFLRDFRYLDDAVALLAAAVRSSRKLKEPGDEAILLTRLGLVYRDLRKLKKSVRAHARAITLSRKRKDPRGRASALNNLGLTLYDLRRFEEAVDAHAKAEKIFRRLGDEHGAAQALSNIGETLTAMGRAGEAAAIHRRAAKIYRTSGDRLGYAQALGGLGMALRDDGKLKKAVAAHTEAVSLMRQLDAPHPLAIELGNLGVGLFMVEKYGKSRAAQEAALEIFERMGDRHSQAKVKGNIGLVRQKQEKWTKAAEAHTEAAELFAETGDDHGLAMELEHLAQALAHQGLLAEAFENFLLAAGLFEQVGEAGAARTAAKWADVIWQVAEELSAVPD